MRDRHRIAVPHPSGGPAAGRLSRGLSHARGSCRDEGLTRFFASNGIILPYGAAACLSTPITRGDAELVVDVFAGFLDSDHNNLDLIQV